MIRVAGIIFFSCSFVFTGIIAPAQAISDSNEFTIGVTIDHDHQEHGPITQTLPRTAVLEEVDLINLSILPSQTSVDIHWSTNINTTYLITWTKAGSDDSHFITDDVFNRNHKAVISNLEPGTTYIYKIIASTQYDKEYILSQGAFSTMSIVEISLLTNVSNLDAAIKKDSVILSWVNSAYANFYKVRIVRNHFFYPRDISEGFIVYEGKSEIFLDEDALQFYDKQYYTIFSYDKHGNISSGSVIKVYRENLGITDNKIISEVSVETEYKSSLNFWNINILQDNKLIKPIFDVMYIHNRSPVIFQIQNFLIPEYIRKIIMTVNSPNTPSVSYMLGNDPNKLVYQTIISSFEYDGAYTILFEMYDYNTQKIITFEGILQVDALSDKGKLEYSLWQYDKYINIVNIATFTLSIFVFWILFIWIVRRPRKLG